MTIRYGILSTAQIVPRFVAGVRASQDGEVVAIASRELAKAQQTAVELGIPKAYGSYAMLCQDEEIDIVYIATYNKGHYAAAKLALQHHKHVLLEKPFTLTLAEAEELFQLAAVNHCFLMEAQKSLFLPITQKLKGRLAAGEFGEIRWLQSVTTYASVEHIPWFFDREAGGGILHGSGSYPLEYMQYLTDKPITQFGGTAVIPEGQTDSQSSLTLRLGENLLANVLLAIGVPLPSQLEIVTEQATIVIPNFWKADQAVIHYHDGHIEKMAAEFSSEFVFEVDHVNACLKEKELLSPVMTKEMTLQTVNVVESLYTQWFR